MLTFSKVKATDVSSLMQHYEAGDYYSLGTEVAAIAHGELCAALGLKEGQKLSSAQVKNILEGLMPDARPGQKERTTSDFLTERRRVDRVAAVDITASMPKDISILRGLLDDDRILTLHRAASRQAMLQVQRLVSCGRRDRGNHQRSGKAFWLEYVHDVNRNLDCDTHSHNLLINIAQDSNGRLVAAEIQELTSAEHVAAMRRIYWAELSAGMRGLGYEIEMREVGGEIELDERGLPRLIERGWILKDGKPCDRIFRIKGTGENVPGIKGLPQALAVLFSSRAAERDRAILAELARRRQIIESYRGRSEGLKPWLKTRGEKWSDWTGRTLSYSEVSLQVRGSRDRKLTEISSNQILTAQLSRIIESNLTDALDELKNLADEAGAREIPPSITLTAEDCCAYAKSHCFARKTVCFDYELLRHALDRGMAHGVDPKEVLTVLENDAGLLRLPGRSELTTLEAVAEEKGICSFVAQGRGKGVALNSTFEVSSKLSSEQRRVVEFCLLSKDQVFGVRGVAGSGKSFTMSEVVRGLSEGQHSVSIIAPTTGAVTSLGADGLPAQTLSSFVLKEGDHPGVGAVVIIDESGLVSCRQLRELLYLAEVKKWRLILAGDSAQHSSVERGDALSVLENASDDAGNPVLTQVELGEIRRQIDPQLKNAVRHLADGHIASGFDAFDDLGLINEFPDDDTLFEEAARLYVRWIESSKSIPKGSRLPTFGVFSPVWSENFAFTDCVRGLLTEKGYLGGEARIFPAYRPMSWTDAQKGNVDQLLQLTPGTVLQAHTKIKGLGMIPGVAYHVVQSSTGEGGMRNLRLKPGIGKEFSVSAADLAKAARNWTPAVPHTLEVRIGDKLLIRANGIAHRYLTSDGKPTRSKLDNGSIVQVRGFDSMGQIELDDGRVIPASFQQFQHGFAVTSHSSQGKTVDKAMVICGRRGVRAMSAKAFYVSCSRSRESLFIFTHDKEELKRAASRSGRRKTALEFLEEVNRAGRWNQGIPSGDAVDAWRPIKVRANPKASPAKPKVDLTAISIAKMLGIYEAVIAWIVTWSRKVWLRLQAAHAPSSYLSEQDRQLIAPEPVPEETSDQSLPRRGDNIEM